MASLEFKNLALAANVEGTYNIAVVGYASQIKLTNPAATSIWVKLDQTVAVADADAFEIKGDSHKTIRCDDVAVIHAICSAINVLTIDVERAFKTLIVTALVASTEKILALGGIAKRVSIINRGTDDVYVRFDNTATEGAGTEELVPAGGYVEIDEINVETVHLISAGTPTVEVRSVEDTNNV